VITFAFCNRCRSEEWQAIPDDEKDTLGLTFDHDGEFWSVVKLQMYYGEKSVVTNNLYVTYCFPATCICADFL